MYKTLATYKGKSYKSITNVGLRPTINQGLDFINRNIETHILDQSFSMYGEKLKVEFIDFIRPEIMFDSLDELKSQVKKDILKIRE